MISLSRCQGLSYYQNDFFDWENFLKINRPFYHQSDNEGKKPLSMYTKQLYAIFYKNGKALDLFIFFFNGILRKNSPQEKQITIYNVPGCKIFVSLIL